MSAISEGRQPAENCENCGSPARGHDWQRGPICETCGAEWPTVDA